MSSRTAHDPLRKELGLLDVYAISTGAMFSSGFFLLPGLAAAQTGPSVALAYLVSAVFILPAMFSVAELATAMPRAGGAYYFLDRSMGPLVGTIGGLGTWVGLVFKSAFALVGMGAYIALYVDVAIKPLAVALTVAFAVLNVLGAKETTRLQRILVGALVGILVVFVVAGIRAILPGGPVAVPEDRFSDFFAFGLTGFMGTVGFVFVSYAGLTKVASVAEEIRDPDRNIPLGMMLSLATAALLYTTGVLIMVAVLPPDVLRSDLTPVASAADQVLAGWPAGLGVGLIVVAAIAAFASTGNAGILAASRYPLAMARDRLVPNVFGKLGRFQTPTFGIAITALLMALAILTLDIEGIAKLASAFQLLLFALLNLAVVIMRESEIEGYDPSYRSPGYPFTQIFGCLAPLWLIAEMGQIAILFTLGLVALTTGWYFHYARTRVRRSGAIFHTFARLGRLRHQGLDLELRNIAKGKGLRAEDPYDEVVLRAGVVDHPESMSVDELAERVVEALASLSPLTPSDLALSVGPALETSLVPMDHGIALLHWRVVGLEQPTMLLVRCAGGLEGSTHAVDATACAALRGVVVLVSRQEAPGQHLRLLGHLAAQIDQEDFGENWISARGDDALRATLVREERTVTLQVTRDAETGAWVGLALRTLDLPTDTLIVIIRRGREAVVPSGATVFQEGDFVMIVGTPDGIRALLERYPGAHGMAIH